MSQDGRPVDVVLVRHGETEWSRTGKHTSHTDVPLTALGRAQARALGDVLRGRQFALVLTSPLERALATCRLAGFGDVAQPRDDLREWDYGEYEGRTTPEIRKNNPEWSLWRDGAPGGEAPEAVGTRADRVLEEIGAVTGDVLVFGHGHLLRVLAARWIGLEPAAGRFLALDAGTVSVLGYERQTAVLRLWNAPP